MTVVLKCFKIVLEIIFVMMLFGVIALLCGCSILQPGQNVVTEPITNTTNVIYETIKSTNWVISFLMLGFVLGLIAAFGLGFKQLGLVTSGACVAGIFLSAAISNTWFYIGAGLVVFASILIVVAGLLLKHKAITELVTGVQSVRKNFLDSQMQEPVKKLLQKEQSKQTQKIVQETKAKIKLKGK